jgi:hypothetical protein
MVSHENPSPIINRYPRHVEKIFGILPLTLADSGLIAVQAVKYLYPVIEEI